MLYVHWTCKAVAKPAADKKELFFMPSSRRVKNLKNIAFLFSIVGSSSHGGRSRSSNFSSISIFPNINFYYNGGIACGERDTTTRDVKMWKWRWKNQDKYEWEWYFIIMELKQLLCLCHHFSMGPHHKHFFMNMLCLNIHWFHFLRCLGIVYTSRLYCRCWN